MWWLIIGGIAVAVATVFIACMCGAAYAAPTVGATVVVLGADIIGDRPCRMLRRRLDAAAAYLRAHPDACCIVSGGQGADELYTEAAVMADYLVRRCGIDGARIACEDESVNTYENLYFSLEVARQRGWSTHLAVSTQVFHQYRAACLARWAGADSVGGIPSYTPLHAIPYYWARECVAILRLWLWRY